MIGLGNILKPSFSPLFNDASHSMAQYRYVRLSNSVLMPLCASKNLSTLRKAVRSLPLNLTPATGRQLNKSDACLPTGVSRSLKYSSSSTPSPSVSLVIKGALVAMFVVKCRGCGWLKSQVRIRC